MVEHLWRAPCPALQIENRLPSLFQHSEDPSSFHRDTRYRPPLSKLAGDVMAPQAATGLKRFAKQSAAGESGPAGGRLALRFAVAVAADGGTSAEAAPALADSSNAELDRTCESAAQRAGTASVTRVHRARTPVWRSGLDGRSRPADGLWLYASSAWSPAKAQGMTEKTPVLFRFPLAEFAGV